MALVTVARAWVRLGPSQTILSCVGLGVELDLIERKLFVLFSFCPSVT
jgi:hypothetical protein